MVQETLSTKHLNLIIDALASDGRGIGRYKGQVVFVPQSVPGQKVSVYLTGENTKYLEASIVSVIESSPYERASLCIHAAECGGCRWQHIEYDQQLYWKKKIVVDVVTRIGHVKQYICFDTIASPQEWYYRNKMEFAFSSGIDGHYLLGLHKYHSHEIVPIKYCYLQSKRIVHILEAVYQWVNYACPFIEKIKKQKEYFRFLVVRESSLGECIVELTVHAIQQFHYINEESLGKSFSQYLQKKCPYISGVVLSSYNSASDAACGEAMLWHEGEYFLKESIGHIDLAIRYDTFFQVNTPATQLLYNVIKEFAQLTGKECIWDLYTGIGSIGLFLAPFVQYVLGIDVVKKSIETACYNAKQLGYNNCHFEAFAMQDFMKNCFIQYPKPDIIIVDPPRAGLDKVTKNALCLLAPQKCIYVSCNPGTFARDISSLSTHFRLLKTQPVDLFPQTPHIETVSLLEYS